MSISGMISFDLADWGGYAACYDALNELSPYQDLQRTVARELGSVEGQSVLEAACGTGNLTQILQQAGRGKEKIWAVDFSEDMLKRARQKCAGTSTCFIRADLNEPLEFPDEFFDKVVSVNTLYALQEPARVLSEFARVLKKGGTFVLVTPKKGYENGLILKEHCKSPKPDEYWFDVHSSPERELKLISEAMQDEELTQRMLAIAAYNREISGTSHFHFFELEALVEMLGSSGLSVRQSKLVYADQNLFVIATPQGGRA